jgi:hypothetical protein
VRAQVERAYRQGYSELDVHENGGASCGVCPHKPLFRDLSMLYLHANGNLPSSPDRAANSGAIPEYPRCAPHLHACPPCTLPWQPTATPLPCSRQWLPLGWAL